MEGRSRNHHRYKNLSLCTLTESHFSNPALMKFIFDMVVKGQEVGGEHFAKRLFAGSPSLIPGNRQRINPAVYHPLPGNP